MKCRMCEGRRLFEFLDLGSTPPADEFKTAEQLRQPDTYYPLQVWICEDCGLAQIGYVVAPETFYQNISSLMSDLPLQAEGKHV